MKKKQIYLCLSAILLLPLALLFTNAYFIIFSIDTYTDFYKQQNTTQLLTDNQTLVIHKTQNLLHYLQEKESLDNADQFYSQREVDHMKDVKNLFLVALILGPLLCLYIAIVFFYFFIYDKPSAAKILIFGSLWTAIALILAGALTFFFFDQLFILFHKLFFRNDLWLLPTDSALIRLFPQSFFETVTMKIGKLTLICAAILFVSGSIYRRYLQRKRNSE